MSNSLFLSLTNLLGFVLWLRMWSAPEAKLFFNPYLAAVHRFSGRLVSLGEPLLPGASSRAVAVLELAFLLLARAVVQYFFATGITIELGSLVARGPDTASLGDYAGFSVLSFLFFLARIWLLARLLEWLAGRVRRDRASDALRFAALPVAYLSAWRQCAVVLLLNMLLAWALLGIGEPAVLMSEQLGLQTLPAPEVTLGGASTLAVLFFLGLAAAADTLSLAQNLMLMSLLLSLAGFLTRRPPLHEIAREWLDVLLGRFGRSGAVRGGIGFAPLIFLLLVPFLRQSIVSMLRRALEAL